MRLLADENFPRPIVEVLRAAGHDVLWARTDCNGWKDAVLLELAESKSRILITLDKDFWQIAVQRKIPLQQSGVVLFRIRPATPEHLMPLVRTFIGASKPWAGHVSVLTADAIQMLSARKGRR